MFGIATKSICEVYGVTKRDLFGESRNTKCVVPRQAWCVVMRVLSDYALHEIGDYEGRTRATVIHSIKVVLNELPARREKLEKTFALCGYPDIDYMGILYRKSAKGRIEAWENGEDY